MTDPERAKLRLYLIAFRWTWPGIILLNASAGLLRLWPWFAIPALAGLGMMLVGLIRTYRIASRELLAEPPPDPVSPRPERPDPERG